MALELRNGLLFQGKLCSMQYDDAINAKNSMNIMREKNLIDKYVLKSLLLLLAVSLPVAAKAQEPELSLSPPVEQGSELSNTRNAETGFADSLPDIPDLDFRAEGFQLPLGDGSGNLSPQAQPQQRRLSQEELEAQIRAEAFDAALTGLFPLRPEEIREVYRKYDETQEAVQTPVYGFPVPEVAVQTISLEPGATPPTIKVAVGHVTTLSILDTTGAPWPIQDIGWAGDFEVTETEEGGHIIRITPLEEFAAGNMSMRLLSLKTPVTFTLRTNRNVVQYRLDVRIPEFGPLAAPPLIEGGGSGQFSGSGGSSGGSGSAFFSGGSAVSDNVLSSILNGVPPEDYEMVDVQGVDGRTTAYKVSNLTYLRTPLKLLSPAWVSSVSSIDGMNVYALEDAPVVLLSDSGKFRRARLSEKSETDKDE